MPGPTVTEQRQRIVREYRESGHLWPASMRQVAAWAIDKGLWEPARGTIVGQLAGELARALREEYFIDPQGREVRAKHAARIAQGAVQSTLWDDIRTADPSHMRIAFQQRRQQIVGDCKQLKTDVDSYNENGNPDEPIQLELNFTQDIAELEALEALERWDGFTDASAQPPPSSRSRDVVPV